jgi:hypothetical protein
MRQFRPFAAPLFASVLIFVGFSIYDLVVLDRLPHAEGPARFDVYHQLRAAASLGLSAWLVASLPDTAWSVGALSVQARRWLGWLCLLASAAILAGAVLFFLSPDLFSALSREDRAIEWATALFLLAGAALAVLSFFRLRGIRGHGSRAARMLALGFGAFLFVLGMEEISWMQHIFNFDTPAAFSGNRQHEMNLHNFATNETETLFYIGAFALLIVLPFFWRSLAASAPPGLHAVMPAPAVAIAGAPMAACNWDMWNIIPIQMTFWMTLMIMGAAARHCYRRNDALWRVYGLMAVCLALTQAVFLAFGEAFVRTWDVTEYKEFFIGFGLFVFATQIRLGARA